MKLLSLLLVTLSPLGVRALVHGVDASCHAVESLDLDGPAVSWGLDFKKPSAQECCDACKACVHAGKEAASSLFLTPPSVHSTEKCNSWVWCGYEKCWSPDVWDHGLHECWLKTQDDPLNPKVNHQGAYAAAYREEHKTAPSHVQWMAGTLI